MWGGSWLALRRLSGSTCLLDAILALPENERPDYLVLGGDGPTMPMVKARVAADPWLKECCRVLGVVTDPPGFLASIDYLVLPSDSEGLPNVLLESMASAKTMIASRVADVPTLIEGVGLLMEPGNQASLEAAFRKMCEMGAPGRAHLGEKAAAARARIRHKPGCYAVLAGTPRATGRKGTSC